MATFSIENVRIKGFSSCVPPQFVDNSESQLFDDKLELEKYISNTGVKTRYVASDGICASDLCYQAANALMDKLDWKPEDVSCMIFVSQSGDYIYPSTACILQDRLKLPTTSLCFDMGVGCPGWVYGFSVIASIVSGMKGKTKALLLTGETVSKMRSPYDRINLITGDAGTATAIEYEITPPPPEKSAHI